MCSSNSNQEMILTILFVSFQLITTYNNINRSTKHNICKLPCIHTRTCRSIAYKCRTIVIQVCKLPCTHTNVGLLLDKYWLYYHLTSSLLRELINYFNLCYISLTHSHTVTSFLFLLLAVGGSHEVCGSHECGGDFFVVLLWCN